MSKALGGSVPGLCVKSSTSSSEVEGWVRMIRGICPMVVREGHRGGRRKISRLMFHKTTSFFLFFLLCTDVFLWVIRQITDERRKKWLTAIVCFSLCRKSSTFRSENGLFSSLPKPNGCIKRKKNRVNSYLEHWIFPTHVRTWGMEQKTMREFDISSLLGDSQEPPTTPLPLQTTASIFLDGRSSGLSTVGLHSCRPATSRWSWGPPGSDVLSLSTVILMQLPAFLRALTASWWVTPCTLRPLTWMESGQVSAFMAGGKCSGGGQRWQSRFGSLKIASLLSPGGERSGLL